MRSRNDARFSQKLRNPNPSSSSSPRKNNMPSTKFKSTFDQPRTAWEMSVMQKVADTMKTQKVVSVWKPVKIATVMPDAVFNAIKKHAGRVKSGKSHFSVDQQMDAIIALADFGSKHQRKVKAVCR